jgi:hypothetical protein
MPQIGSIDCPILGTFCPNSGLDATGCHKLFVPGQELFVQSAVLTKIRDAFLNKSAVLTKNQGCFFEQICCFNKKPGMLF